MFNISHFSSAECSEVMSKRTQKDSGEERVTAKSRPMMNLIARSSERVHQRYHLLHQKARWKPDTKVKVLWVCKLRSSRKRRSPLFAVARVTSATDLLKTHTHSSYSEWNIDKSWSSQEWKSDELMDDGTGRPVVCPQGGAHQSVIEDDETESDLSLGSRSFLHTVNND